MGTTTDRGSLIVFEGIDGAGKTTQIALLKDWLKEQGKKVFCTAEPTESLTGGMLRDALSGNARRSVCEMAALFTLDRIFHNVNPVNGIEKMLGDGYTVICDRYYYSSLAYQGAETDAAWVRAMNLGCPEIRRPDLCLFLDLSPEESMKRITRDRPTLEIYESLERLGRIRNQFHRVLGDLPGENIHILDASCSPEELHATIRRLVGKELSDS